MPETLEYDHNVMTSDAGDKTLHVVFYMHFLKNEQKSIDEGRNIFDDVPFTKIFPPGDRTNIIDRPTREGDKLRFPQQWARFKNAEEQRADGTPLVEWPIITRGQAEELKFLGFTTVEQVAIANDNTRMMGLQELKNKAKIYLETAKGNTAPVEQMLAKMNEVLAQNKILMENIEATNAENAELKKRVKA